MYIDVQRQALLVPMMGGVVVPFHVSCIKNVSKIDEGKAGPSLRVNFFTTETSTSSIQFPSFDGSIVFIKELQLRNRTLARISDIINQIKSLQKRVKAE